MLLRLMSSEDGRLLSEKRIRLGHAADSLHVRLVVRRRSDDVVRWELNASDEHPGPSTGTAKLVTWTTATSRPQRVLSVKNLLGLTDAASVSDALAERVLAALEKLAR